MSHPTLVHVPIICVLGGRFLDASSVLAWYGKDPGMLIKVFAVSVVVAMINSADSGETGRRRARVEAQKQARKWDMIAHMQRCWGKLIKSGIQSKTKALAAQA